MLVSFATICIAWKDRGRSEVLLLRRPSAQAHHLAGQWFFPGGVVEPGEHARDAAARETLEETGISVENLGLIDVYVYRETWSESGERKTLDIALAVYEGFFAHGIVRACEEADEVRWIRVGDLKAYLRPETIRSHLSSEVRAILGLT